jgi:hypothetical protein
MPRLRPGGALKLPWPGGKDRARVGLPVVFRGRDGAHAGERIGHYQTIARPGRQHLHHLGDLVMTAPPFRFRAAGPLALLVVVGGLAGCSGSTGPVVGTPSAAAAGSSSPSPTPAAKPSPSRAPSFDFGGATALDGGTHIKVETKAGVTYYTDLFAIPFTSRPGAGWWVENNIRTLTSFERGPHSPNGAPIYLVQFVVPTQVVLPDNAGLMPAPVDLLGWLHARPDLVLSAPSPITVAGIQGSMIEGGLRAGAALNPEGGLNLICGELSECGWEGGQLIGVGPSGFHEFVLIEVRGTQVIIALSGPAATRSTTQKTFDAFLKTFAFPAPQPG